MYWKMSIDLSRPQVPSMGQLDPLNQESETWKAHLDINTVVLATSLFPDGFLTV